MTKTQLAKELGVSLNTYAEYVKGSSIPSSKLCLLADILEVSTDYLLGRTDEKGA